MPETTYEDEMAGGLRPLPLRARVLAVVAALAIILGGGAALWASPASAQPAAGSSVPAAENGEEDWSWLYSLNEEELRILWDAILNFDENGDIATPRTQSELELLLAAILTGINPCAVMPWTC